jgi:hypothetical protein
MKELSAAQQVCLLDDPDIRSAADKFILEAALQQVNASDPEVDRSEVFTERLNGLLNRIEEVLEVTTR